MKKIAVEKAVGKILCHDITAVRDGFKGRAFVRGHVIKQEDIPKLLDMGKKYIFIWEDQEAEIHEDDAALRLASMAPVKGSFYSGPYEGKMTLTAAVKGQFRVNKTLLSKLNTIGDITITTLPDHFRVEPDMKLAGLRIVPLTTEKNQIEQAEIICAQSPIPLFTIKPYQKLKVGIIITGSEIFNGRIKDRFEPLILKKLSYFEADILDIVICDDIPDMLQSITSTFIRKNVDLLIFTGGMSVDPDDITPTVIRATGAEVITHGVPIQPGNMFMLAYLGNTSIIGVPSAAIQHSTTILDVVLPQLFTGERFYKEDFVAMAEGGSCLGCEICHYPVCTFGRY